MAALPEKRWFLLGEVCLLIGVLFYFGVIPGAYSVKRMVIAFIAGSVSCWLLLSKPSPYDE